MASGSLRCPRHALFFEKRVSTLSALLREVDLLDLDSGIRTLGDYKGMKKQFVFVTRSPHDAYTAMVYEKAGRFPGHRLAVKEFATKGELAGFLRRSVSRPVEAFVY